LEEWYKSDILDYSEERKYHLIAVNQNSYNMDNYDTKNDDDDNNSKKIIIVIIIIMII
jgi:hypothetical protein